MQNILVLVGWADVSENFDKNRFNIAFIEEVSELFKYILYIFKKKKKFDSA